ncbi:MAG: hypothetical protein RLZZ626_76 [Actinomycetota bacterium]
MLFRKVALVASAVLTLASLQLTAIAASAATPPLAQGGQTCTIVGTGGNDTLNGTAGNDVICGLGGNDNINGLAGSDVIDAGAGTDIVNAGAGDDLIFGGAGNDNLLGGAGNDTMLGGAGNDIDNGQTGTDTASFADATAGVTADLVTDAAAGFGVDSLINDENLTGSAFGDTLNGDSLGNILDGGAGNDTESGNSGNDLVSGGSGDDNLSGGAGADSLQGGSGNDTLSGGAANDILTGGAGNDSLVGGDGTDTANYSDNTGGVTVDLGAGTETGQGTDTLQGDENVTGGSGNDSITGNGSNNGLSGGPGDDFISGGGGNDTESGGTGDDTLTGDAGKDKVNGNDGSNVCDIDELDTAVNCLEDKVAPELVDFKIAESGNPIDVTTANHTLHSTVHLKENFGKIKVAEFYFGILGGGGPSIIFSYACGYNGCGNSSMCDADGFCIPLTQPAVPVTGTKFDGTYALDLDLSKLKRFGTYSYFGGSLVDAVGNSHTFTAEDNAKLSSQNFTVVGAPVDPNADVVAPQVHSISITSLPETGSGQPITVRFHVSDAQSGVKSGSVYFTNGGGGRGGFTVNYSSAENCAALPAMEFGWGVIHTTVPVACLISGDANDGIYETSFKLPRFLLFGDYSSYQGTATDNAGNSYFYNPFVNPVDPYGAYAGKWHRDSFEYGPTEDYDPPTISSYSWSSPVINTGKADAVQFVDIAYSDPSGLALLWIQVAPTGKNYLPIGMLTYTNLIVPGRTYLEACSPTNLGMVVPTGSQSSGGCQVSGDEYAGVIRFGFKVPRASASGAWDITQFTFVDISGNQGGLSWGSGIGTSFTNTPTN